MFDTIHMKHGFVVGAQTSIFTIFNPEKYDMAAIPAVWQDFFSKATGTDLAESDTFYGASIPSMSRDTPMEYFAGTLVDLNFKIPEGFASVEIPEGDYLKVIHTGPISDIAATYQRAYMEAITASGKEMRPAPHLEIYSSKKDPMEADYEMVICIPIK